MTNYMLALFSTFVIGLWFFLVRALKRPPETDPVSNRSAVVETKSPVHRVFYDQHTLGYFILCTVGQSAVISPLTVAEETIDEIHAPDSASARARRQGPGVPVRPVKRQRLMMLEVA